MVPEKNFVWFYLGISEHIPSDSVVCKVWEIRNSDFFLMFILFKLMFMNQRFVLDTPADSERHIYAIFTILCFIFPVTIEPLRMEELQMLLDQPLVLCPLVLPDSPSPFHYHKYSCHKQIEWLNIALKTNTKYCNIDDIWVFSLQI